MISFKPLESSDFSLLNKWMNIDFVSRWYDMRKFVYDDVEKKYHRGNAKPYPVNSFIVQIDSLPAGYMQMYKIHDYPEYAASADVSKSTAGIDLFIGDKQYWYKGYGKDIVTHFIKTHVWEMPEVNACIAGLEPSNVPALRMYEKAGFQTLKKIMHQGIPEIILLRKKSENHVVYSMRDSVAKQAQI